MALSDHSLVFYLGIKDEYVNDSPTSWKVNKVGGTPDWTSTSLKSAPDLKCCLCGKQRLLLVQVYSPLDRTEWYHRTLYVFCCISPNCWNKQESYKVIRSQETCDGSEVTNLAQAKQVVSSDWLDSQDDWGSGPGSPSVDPQAEEGKDLTKSLQGLVVSTADDNLCDDDMDFAEVQPETIEGVDAVKRACELKRVEQEQRAALESLSAGSTFRSYYVGVIEEDRDSEGDFAADSHVEKLLQNYELEDGSASKKISKGQGSSSYAQETYEKASISHGDQTFYKFHKRLQRCPEQLIRFCWDGKPLFISRPPASWVVPTCANCGARRCFELQVMPALIPTLEIEGAHFKGCPLEFGTILIYSCSASCWSAQNTWLEEVAFIQPDPDVAFWNRVVS
uniref:Putative programmed cell death protein n=1 Tax=Ixodes ricinus TaxID=34613 RepID=A0A131Y5N9_IXORI